MTALDLLAAAIRAQAGVSGSMEPPAAILWTDASRDWSRLLPAARSRIPELLVLGDYRPDDRTGPAITARLVMSKAFKLAGVGSRPRHGLRSPAQRQPRIRRVV